MTGLWGAVSGRWMARAAAVTMLGLLAACGGSAPNTRISGVEAEVTLEGMRDPSQYVADERIDPAFRGLDGWGRDNHAQVLPALRKSCAWMATQPPAKMVSADGTAGTMGDWAKACQRLAEVPDGNMEAARLYLETNFQPKALGDGEPGLFTGYYEPTLHGSWNKGGRYTVPLYRKPATSKKLPDRAKITSGALAGHGLELMWVDSAVDAFILEIQGSGRVMMNDGSVVGIGYAGQNGQPYYPIGRYLIDQGYATKDQMNMPFIRRWLSDNPDQAQKVMNLNPSYVFFKLRNGDARGARDIALTPGRSLAVDTEFVPIGPPLWVDLGSAPVPGGKIQRLVCAQDTGGAIKGAVRGDLFWGADANAEMGAGLMRAQGRYWMLVPRERTLNLARMTQ